MYLYQSDFNQNSIHYKCPLVTPVCISRIWIGDISHSIQSQPSFALLLEYPCYLLFSL